MLAAVLSDDAATADELCKVDVPVGEVLIGLVTVAPLVDDTTTGGVVWDVYTGMELV